MRNGSIDNRQELNEHLAEAVAQTVTSLLSANLMTNIYPCWSTLGRFGSLEMIPLRESEFILSRSVKAGNLEATLKDI